MENIKLKIPKNSILYSLTNNRNNTIELNENWRKNEGIINSSQKTPNKTDLISNCESKNANEIKHALVMMSILKIFFKQSNICKLDIWKL